MTDGNETRIEVNGVVYHSPDDVPDSLRPYIAQLLADDDGDGVPDILQGPDATSTVDTERTETVIVDATDDASAERILGHGSATPAPSTEHRPTERVTRQTVAPVARSVSIVTEAGPSVGSRPVIALVAIAVLVAGVAVWLLR